LSSCNAKIKPISVASSPRFGGAEALIIFVSNRRQTTETDPQGAGGSSAHQIHVIQKEFEALALFILSRHYDWNVFGPDSVNVTLPKSKTAEGPCTDSASASKLGTRSM
jgi:hypothetical protein